jgi:hypothetical protein
VSPVNGNILVAGSGILLIVAASPTSAAPGDLDRTYSGDGITKAGFYRQGDSILLDSQGKVLVGGSNRRTADPRSSVTRPTARSTRPSRATAR